MRLRRQAPSPIDFSVGLELLKKVLAKMIRVHLKMLTALVLGLRRTSKYRIYLS